AHHRAEPLVGGHLVVHRDRRVHHPAVPVRGERVGGQPGPQHHAVRRGIARCHTEGERVRRPARRPEPATARRRRPHHHGDRPGGGQTQRLPAGECHIATVPSSRTC